jgi:hypothetical protein
MLRGEVCQTDERQRAGWCGQECMDVARPCRHIVQRNRDALTVGTDGPEPTPKLARIEPHEPAVLHGNRVAIGFLWQRYVCGGQREKLAVSCSGLLSYDNGSSGGRLHLEWDRDVAEAGPDLACWGANREPNPAL